MSKRRHYFLLIIIGFICLMPCVPIYLSRSGILTWEMYKDPGYRRWALGEGAYNPEYFSTFLRDPPFRDSLVGRPIEVLKPLFPGLQSGANYRPSSYRAEGRRPYLARYAGSRVEDYWVDGTQHDFGLCVVAVDGRIKAFHLIKG